LPIVADPDTTSTLSVDLTESGGILANATHADADGDRTLCFVDGELISYGTATLVSTNKYNLTYLRRNQLQSSLNSHSIGSAFLRLDDAIFVYQFDPNLVNTTVHFEFTSFNRYQYN